MEATEVLVIGAGPTGLLLAGDLAEAGVSVALLERRPTDAANLTRAFAVHARTLEQLDARGVADELLDHGVRVDAFELFGRVRLGLAGLASRFPFVLVTPQYQTEAVLMRRAEAAGVRIERGTEVVALRQDADGVEVDVRDGWGELTTKRAAYLVGTDGAHSTIRRLLGEPFPGRSVVQSLMLADVQLTSPPSSGLTVRSGAAGFLLIAPFGDGWYRVFAWDRANQQPDSAPVSLAEVRDLVRNVAGTDFGMREARWTSRFHSDERQVAHYRVGRVFLAGDAAHVHSPAGGQGMNTGLQDAANLGWRLAGAIRGWAGAEVLDGYQAERHRVGRMVLRGSNVLLRAALQRGAVPTLIRASVATVVARIRPLTRLAAGALTGIGVRYPAPAGAHRRVGTRVPDLALTGAGPGRLYEALRGGRFVLVSPPEPTKGDTAEVARETAARAGWRGPVTMVTSAQPLGTALLVRPDGYLAWANGLPGR
ncbi:MAG TPA: FAD-dependent monooxygenase [Pseudonocardia sp.]|jgi:2-polyprenyl-6-methoxyphenol hydroxylase-like FAD-dependent oxidoreductase